jgi:hypothetical protein
MEALGIVSIILFFFITIGSIKGWIPQDILPIQTSLTMGAVLLWVLGLAMDQSLTINNFAANIYLHPISAVIAGFLVAGALEAAGGFTAAMALLERIEKTRLGLAGAVVLLVNFPNIFAMPCGRIWVVALFPLAVMFGYNIAQKKSNPLLAAVVVFGFIVNAAASCGPSPLGGIGMSGEGMGGYPLGSLSNAQSLAIMVISAVTMVSIKFMFKVLVHPYHGEMNHEKTTLRPTRMGYYSFFILTGGLSLVFIAKPQIPIQTVLAVIGITILVVAKLSIRDVIGGIILHPILAMISGFIFAGALLITGGFDTLIVMLTWVAEHTPLGYVGVAVLLTFSPSILPMPCGRIIGVALLPGVIMFGQRIMEMNGAPLVLPAMLTAFIINAAASCAPSRMGGVGEIGEGLLGVQRGLSTRPQQVGILFGTGTAALLIALFGFL